MTRLILILFILGIIFSIIGLIHVDKRFSYEYSQKLMIEGDAYCNGFNKELRDINLVPIWKTPTFFCRSLGLKEGGK